MITLTGTLRQAGEVTFKDKPPRLKLTVEHETPRENGMPDLHLETLFLAPEEAATLPRTGQPVHIEVRPYPNASGRGISFAAVRLLAPAVVADPSVEKDA